ncbi:MAG: TIGR00266 family protein [Peptococcaceae bacterium]
MRRAHEIDFQIHGADMQFVEIGLDPGETVVAEAGAMMYMDGAVQSDTVFGDGSDRDRGKGFMDKVMGAGKRALTGESLFMTTFTNAGMDKKVVAFAAPYPGKVISLDLTDCQGQLICQRDAFLCAAKGIAVEIAFQKKIGAGLFGGEGFIMQRLVGDGLVFLHAGGTIMKKELQAGEVLKLDTGCLVAMTAGISYDVEFVGNLRSAIFGGEGLFLATLRGPGQVWLQSLPFSRLANRMYAAGSKGGGESKGEGSLLSGIGLKNLFSGD